MSLKVNTPKGDLKYRLPDISEGYEYLCFVETIQTSSDVFKIKAKIIKHMSELIEFKELGYDNYQEVLNDKENMRDALSEISKAIFDDILELLGKKI
jgi:hypothetical protein